MTYLGWKKYHEYCNLKKHYLAQKKRSSVMGVEPTTVWSEVQIKYKYKSQFYEGAKWYPVRVLLI